MTNDDAIVDGDNNNDGGQDDCIDCDRFRHPRPIDSWEGLRETKQLPNSCIQVRLDIVSFLKIYMKTCI